jgi:hypothetical protein
MFASSRASFLFLWDGKITSTGLNSAVVVVGGMRAKLALIIKNVLIGGLTSTRPKGPGIGPTGRPL